MSTQDHESQRATDYLNGLLHEAVESGADTVELERVPEGLEICFLAAESGIGTVLKDRALEEELFDLIIRRGKLGNRGRGKMDWNVLGEDRRITVEQYDSFGEACFRLKLDKPQPRK
ncbi:hypothetical protein SBV1_950007 [Verrucomicrobia bacterium]|nr:hypothetical protein SBV1_950007 [Verrucomicrobiota bacterium]